MIRSKQSRFSYSLILLLLFCKVFPSKASHLYGGDLFYTHITGNRYTVTMVLYGDCGGTASVFSQLYSASPRVVVSNGSTVFRTMNLKVEAGAGTEVTPVCTSSLGSTICNGGTVPGIRRFVYSDTITLSPSANWRFRSNGELGTSTTSPRAGRSNTITNISSPGLSVMALEATLNNSSTANSNPQFTTIPTPFFCINVSQEYNQGAVDPNTGDSLTYSLVSGLDASSWPATTVSYLTGYSATSPLATATGAFSFSTSTGQLSFTPNRSQISLVVCRVNEYRSGVLVGSCMREMNFIVLSSCSNRSPYGKISSVSGAKLRGNTVVDICKNENALGFNINPTDSDGNNITLTVSGLPSGASLAITGNGTSSPSCSFSWNISSVAVGTYNFYITYQDDACPLSSKQTVVYTINVLPKASFTVSTISDASCIKKGIFEVKPNPSLSSWTLRYASGATVVGSKSVGTASLRDSLNTGTYTIRVIDTNGCFDDQNYTINPPPAVLISSLTVNNILCHGDSSGSVVIVGSGGLSPYQYQINSGTFTTAGSYADLKAGVYTLRVRDANFCTKDSSISLNQPTKLNVNSTLKKPLCKDLNDGMITVVATGGVTPYSYTIGSSAPFITSNVFAGLPKGAFLVRIKDANNCVQSSLVNLSDSITMNANALVNNVSCNGGNNGSITILPTAGISPYQYAIGTGSYNPSAIFNSLSAGSYLIRYKDSFGCTADTTLMVTQPSKLLVAASIENNKCFGENAGKITLIGAGGVSPYLYALNSSTFSGIGTYGSLSSGSYNVIVKDSNGCTDDTTVSISQPSAITTNIIAKNPLCFGDKNGEIDVNVSGGIAPYQYQINGSGYASIKVFRTLGGGSYLISIKDANNCIKDTTITLVEPAALRLSLSSKKPICKDRSDGMILAAATGGVGNYTFAISPIVGISDSNRFSSLAAGTYIITLKDENNCTQSATQLLIDSVEISVTQTTKNVSCFGLSNGEIMLKPNVGASPFIYSITSPSGFTSSPIFSSLKAGTYNIVFKDSLGCSSATTALITEPTMINIATDITNISCNGLKDGTITIKSTGGTLPHTYALNASAFGGASSFTSLGAASYKISIKDANGCIKDSNILLLEPAPLSLQAKIQNPLCFGDSNGRVDIIGIGGIRPYNFSLSKEPFSVDSFFTQLKSGIFPLTIKDNNGCEKDTTINLTQPNQLLFGTITTIQPTCENYTDGSVQLTVSGGTKPYLFSTNNANFDGVSLREKLKEGLYLFTVRDSNFCSVDTNISLKGYPKIILDSVITTPTLCFGSTEGALRLYASGGNPPLRYVFENSADTNKFASYQNLGAQNYTITVMDTTNCVRQFIARVPQPDPLNITATVTHNDCTGNDSSGIIQLIVRGGTPSYQFSWRSISENTDKIEGLPNGFYSVRVTDQNNCKDSLTSEVYYDNCCTPAIPNAFTPNNDGKNDIFKIIYTGDIELKEMSIYNRYGQKVFSTNNVNQGWDGRFNGQAEEMGVYYYMLRMICGNRKNKEVFLKGDVTLIR